MLNFGDEKINKMGDKYAHKMQQQCHFHETILDTMGKGCKHGQVDKKKVVWSKCNLKMIEFLI
jgi:hypothetical protein